MAQKEKPSNWPSALVLAPQSWKLAHGCTSETIELGTAWNSPKSQGSHDDPISEESTVAVLSKSYSCSVSNHSVSPFNMINMIQ